MTMTSKWAAGKSSKFFSSRRSRKTSAFACSATSTLRKPGRGNCPHPRFSRVGTGSGSCARTRASVSERSRARRRRRLPLRGEKTRRAEVAPGRSGPLRRGEGEPERERGRVATDEQRDRDGQGEEVGRRAPQPRNAGGLQQVGRRISVPEQRPHHLAERILHFERETLADGGREPGGRDACRSQASHGRGPPAGRLAKGESDADRREG